MAKYCAHCMGSLTGQEKECPFCGESLDYIAQPHHLTPGTILNDHFYVGKALGQGGFGITYIGINTKLERRVAIKEFYPNACVNRNNTISPNVLVSQSENQAKFFEYGKARFLDEARNLALFSNESGIVNVSDYFEENNTAYIIMEYLDGTTLKERVSRKGKLSVEETLRLLYPIMLSLSKMHKQGIIHRDISPDNIMISDDGKAKLLDFGAARFVSAAASSSLSIVLKPGFAPEEQYRSKGVQGPWTDIYALCATIYTCITGIIPDDAPQRQHLDELKAPSALGVEINGNIEWALMKGLSVSYVDRFQSVEELIEGFSGRGRKAGDGPTGYWPDEPGGEPPLPPPPEPPKPDPPIPEPPKPDPPKPDPPEPPKPEPRTNNKLIIAICLVGIIAIVAVVVLMIINNNNREETGTENTPGNTASVVEDTTIESTTQPTHNIPSVDNISLKYKGNSASNGRLYMYSEGSTLTVSAEIDSYDELEAEDIVWVSSDPRVVSVAPSDDGKSCTLTKISNGQCTIIVSVGEISDSLTVVGTPYGYSGTVTSENVFSILPDYFYFSSNAGGWWTRIYINDDGSFTGRYIDSELGYLRSYFGEYSDYYFEDIPEHPNSWYDWCCDFTGKFEIVEQISNYEFRLEVTELEFLNTPGTWEEKSYDGEPAFNIYTEPRGITELGDFYLYLPGRETADLDPECVSWIRIDVNDFEETDYLKYWGLYSTYTREAFAGMNGEFPGDPAIGYTN